MVADALNRLSDPLGGNAASHELGNVRSRQESLGAAVVLHVGLSRHGLPVELSGLGGPFEGMAPLSAVSTRRQNLVAPNFASNADRSNNQTGQGEQ